MAEPPQPVAAFPAWARLNGIDINDLLLTDVPGKGFGFVATRKLSPFGDVGSSDAKTGKYLVRVPRDLILSTEAVNEYAKVDQHFHQLLKTVGPQSARWKIVLYLFSHLVGNNRISTGPGGGIAPTAWTEYIKLLPRDIPLPSLWSEHERCLLQGTSLEAAVEAKMAALESEFEQLRESTLALPFWNNRWWEKETATIHDWVLADAWYRSRCLELPQVGEAMVPGLDMVNHSYNPTALYEELNDGDVVLQLRPGCSLSEGEEITISYGHTKSAAEMLFSYGFIDASCAARELMLPLDVMPDDPLGRAKLHAYGKPPTVKLSLQGDSPQWESPFMHLMCLNEEDGLDFRVLQAQDGDRHLRVFWQDQDVTEKSDRFDELIQGHPLEQVFKLRVVAMLEQVVESHLDGIGLSLPGSNDRTNDPAQTAPGLVEVANNLRSIETEVLKAVAVALGTKRGTLLKDETVLRYLGRMEDDQNEQAAPVSTNEEPDFS